MASFFRKSAKDGLTARDGRDQSEHPRERAIETDAAGLTSDQGPTSDVDVKSGADVDVKIRSGVDAKIGADMSPDAGGASSQPSVIGPGLAFKGTLLADEDLLIQGRIEGSIRHRGTRLTIGPHGVIKADIAARRIIVQGTVQGDLHAAESIVIEASARVVGNVSAPCVGIEDGAKFKGSVDTEARAEGAVPRTNPDGSGKAAIDKNGGSLGGSLGERRVHELLDLAHS